MFDTITYPHNQKFLEKKQKSEVKKMEQYELESRHKNGIYATKILGIGQNNIIVKNPINPKTCIRVPVSDSDYYGIGLYVDVAIANKGESFRANLIGITPPEFVLVDGKEIY